jgi:hypothetical protein
MAGESKEAWQSLKCWYKVTTNCTPKVSKMSLATQTAERTALYGRVASKGDPIPIHIEKADIPDHIFSDAKLRDCVRSLWNGCAAGTTGLQAEHIKVLLADPVRKEEEEGDLGVGNKWQVFVKMMQTIWELGSIPEQMRWEIIALLPKGSGDYRGIGLLELFWKVEEKVMIA